MLIEVSLEKQLKNVVVLLISQNIKVGLFLTIENVEYVQTDSDLIDFVDLHGQLFGQLDFFHYLEESQSIWVFSDFQLFAESVNNQLNQILVVDLELFSLVLNLIYEYLQLDSGAVLWIDEFVDNCVELVGVTV